MSDRHTYVQPTRAIAPFVKSQPLSSSTQPTKTRPPVGQYAAFQPPPSAQAFYGSIITLSDALLVIEAARLGKVPRVVKRLDDFERAAIGCGSAYVWSEDEARMKRWTDGKCWSPSRIQGSFLIYREVEKPLRYKRHDRDVHFSDDGLIKRAISLTARNGDRFHLISYITQSMMDRLPTPSTSSQFKNIAIPQHLYLGLDTYPETPTTVLSLPNQSQNRHFSSNYSSSDLSSPSRMGTSTRTQPYIAPKSTPSNDTLTNQVQRSSSVPPTQLPPRLQGRIGFDVDGREYRRESPNLGSVEKNACPYPSPDTKTLVLAARAQVGSYNLSHTPLTPPILSKTDSDTSSHHSMLKSRPCPQFDSRDISAAAALTSLDSSSSGLILPSLMTALDQKLSTPRSKFPSPYSCPPSRSRQISGPLTRPSYMNVDRSRVRERSSVDINHLKRLDAQLCL